MKFVKDTEAVSNVIMAVDGDGKELSYRRHTPPKSSADVENIMAIYRAIVPGWRECGGGMVVEEPLLTEANLRDLEDSLWDILGGLIIERSRFSVEEHLAHPDGYEQILPGTRVRVPVDIWQSFGSGGAGGGAVWAGRPPKVISKEYSSNGFCDEIWAEVEFRPGVYIKASSFDGINGGREFFKGRFYCPPAE